MSADMTESSDQANQCPISGELVQVSRLPHLSLISIYNCPRCGEFAMDALTHVQLLPTDPNRAKVSACLRERKIHGRTLVHVVMQKPESAGTGIPTVTWDDLLATFPKIVEDRLERALMNLAKLLPIPSRSILRDPSFNPVLFAEDDEVATWTISALHDKAWIKEFGGPRLMLSARGWDRVAELEREQGRIAGSQAFIAMRLSDGWEVIYEGIERGVRAAGYEPYVMPKKEHIQRIDDLIISEIRRSRFMVADFTGQRQSVYFEAGFANGLGIPIIWTCRKNEIDQLHFDTRQYNHIDWESPLELAERLEQRIRAVIY